MLPLIQILVLILVMGLIAWLMTQIPLPPSLLWLRTVAIAVVVIIMIVYLLSWVGLLPSGHLQLR